MPSEFEEQSLKVLRASVSQETRISVLGNLPGWASREASIEAALEILRGANKSIGIGYTLTEGERAALYLNGRIQEYLYNRLDHGDEIFEAEKILTGDGVMRVLIYLGKHGRI